jgi:hypothetical protein
MKIRSRSVFSCDRGSAALDCLIYLSFRINRLAWRLACHATEEAAQCGSQARGQEVEGLGDHIPGGKPPSLE